MTVDEDDVAEAKLKAALMEMIPLAEGNPAVLVDGTDRAVYLCRRLSGLRLAADENCFYGECDWVDPADARPDELTDGMAISFPDCLQVGPGWWYDAYFNWYFVFDPALVARSLSGDHSWVPGFLAR
jgi:hypothetical protein